MTPLNGHRKWAVCLKPPKCRYCQRCSHDYQHHLRHHRRHEQLIHYYWYKRNSIVHDQFVTHKKPYKCEYCREHFERQEDLTTHEQDKHYLACKYCHKTFKWYNRFRIHEQSHTKEERYVCKYCHKSSRSSSRLKSHELIHTQEKPYVCKYCHKSFSQRGVLNRHEQIHTGKKRYKCEFCNETFNWKSHLIAHKRIHSTNICQTSASSTWRFNTPGLNATTENLSNESTTPAENTQTHLCPYCAKEFPTLGEVKDHVQLSHTHKKAMVYNCQFCNKIFMNSYYLSVHEQEHNKDENKVQVQIHVNHTKTRQRIQTAYYMCKYCNKSFTHYHDLIVHEQDHHKPEINTRIAMQRPPASQSPLRGVEQSKTFICTIVNSHESKDF